MIVSASPNLRPECPRRIVGRDALRNASRPLLRIVAGGRATIRRRERGTRAETLRLAPSHQPGRYLSKTFHQSSVSVATISSDGAVSWVTRSLPGTTRCM